MKELRPSQTIQEKTFKHGGNQVIVQRLDLTPNPNTSRFQILVDDDDFKYKPISTIELKGEHAPIEFAFAEYLRQEALRQHELSSDYLKEAAQGVKAKFLEIYTHNYETIATHLDVIDLRLDLRKNVENLYGKDHELVKEYAKSHGRLIAQKEELREEAQRLGYDTFEQLVRRNRGQGMEAQLTGELFKRVENGWVNILNKPKEGTFPKEFGLEELKRYSPDSPEVIKAADYIGKWAMETSTQITAERQQKLQALHQPTPEPPKRNRWALAPSKQPKEETHTQKKSTFRFKR